jgi:hypothetical protein
VVEDLAFAIESRSVALSHGCPFMRSKKLARANADPYGFPLIKNDLPIIRYVRTKMIEGYIPPLAVAFTITDENDVVLQWAKIADEGAPPNRLRRSRPLGQTLPRPRHSRLAIIRAASSISTPAFKARGKQPHRSK